MSPIIHILRRAAAAPAMAGIHVKSVALAATYDATADAYLTITWTMPDASATLEAPACAGVTGAALVRPADTVVRLPRAGRLVADLEVEVLDAAWALGAWDVARLECAPLASGSDWRDARYGLAGDFGRQPMTIGGQPLAEGDAAPDGVCAIAAAEGYVLWRWVPLALAAPLMRRRWAGKDATLGDACGRSGGCPGGYRPPMRLPEQPGTGAEHIYRLGRAPHGNRSPAARERRA